MNRKEYEYLLEQQSGLDDLLTMVPEDAVIDRISLQSRRDRVAAKLAAYPAAPRWPAMARLTFGGRPVAVSGGIAIDFANRAVKEFADTVVSVGASLRGSLSDRGRIPNQEKYSLLITGTATGSFGFEIEEDVARSGRTPEGSLVEPAIEQVNTIFKSLSGNDEALAAALRETHPRAIKNMRNFLQILATNDATCALAFKDDTFRFTDVGQVKRSLDRLGPDNINEYDDTLAGIFIGYLPDSRRAEFRSNSTGEVICGKVDTRIRNADLINDHRNQQALVDARVRKVGNGRPHYTFVNYTII